MFSSIRSNSQNNSRQYEPSPGGLEAQSLKTSDPLLSSNFSKIYPFKIYFKALAASALTKDQFTTAELYDDNFNWMSMLTESFAKKGLFEEKDLRKIGEYLFEANGVSDQLLKLLGQTKNPYYAEVFRLLSEVEGAPTIENLEAQKGVNLDFEKTANKEIVSIVLRRDPESRQILEEVLYVNSPNENYSVYDRFLISPEGYRKKTRGLTDALILVAIDRARERDGLITNCEKIPVDQQGSHGDIAYFLFDESPFDLIYKMLKEESVDFKNPGFFSVYFDLIVKERINSNPEMIRFMIDTFCPSPVEYIDDLSKFLLRYEGARSFEQEDNGSVDKVKSDLAKDGPFNVELENIFVSAALENLKVGGFYYEIILREEIKEIHKIRTEALKAYQVSPRVSWEQAKQDVEINDIIYYARLMKGMTARYAKSHLKLSSDNLYASFESGRSKVKYSRDLLLDLVEYLKPPQNPEAMNFMEELLDRYYLARKS